MKKSLVLLVIVSCLAIGQTILAAEAYDEHAILDFDNRDWVAGFAHATKTEIIDEYILKGETVDNWSELVTTMMYFIEADKDVLSQARDFYKGSVLNKCSEANWESLYTSDKMIICAWNVEPCIGSDSAEYTMVCFVQGAKYLHTLLYAAKDKEVFEKNKWNWLKIFQQVKFFTPGDADMSEMPSPLSDTSKMIHIVYRYENSKISDDSFYKKPKEIWRSGKKYFRAEEMPDSANKQHLLYVCTEPDIWIVNRFDNTGKHAIDEGATQNTITPVFGEIRADGLTNLEFGTEQAFFDFYGARYIGEEDLDGDLCQIFELTRLYWILRLYVSKETGLPRLITRQGPDMVFGSVIYEIYEPNLSFDPSLFVKPGGIEFEEFKQ